MKRAPVNGAELEYEIRGDGEPVLLVHGSLLAGSFVPVMKEPSLANYRLIRYHRRGYAGSTGRGDESPTVQAADAVALLRQLGVERAHIVGHSSGGRVALQLAIEAPDAVHSVTVLEPSGMGPTPAGVDFAKEVFEPAIERYRSGDAVGAVDIFMRAVAGPNWRTETARAVPGSPEQAERDAATYFGGRPSRGSGHLDRKHVERISQPALYVSGSETLRVIKEARELFHVWLPAAEDHVIRGVGHSLPIENPRAVAEVIGDFLKRHPMRE